MNEKLEKQSFEKWANFNEFEKHALEQKKLKKQNYKLSLVGDAYIRGQDLYNVIKDNTEINFKIKNAKKVVFYVHKPEDAIDNIVNYSNNEAQNILIANKRGSVTITGKNYIGALLVGFGDEALRQDDIYSAALAYRNSDCVETKHVQRKILNYLKSQEK